MIHTKTLDELKQSDLYGSVVISHCGCNLSSALSAQHFPLAMQPHYHSKDAPLQNALVNIGVL
ncbi:MAG: hypothetical protein QNL62_04645 [Gammaproteobacteria bacterium]|nr:hypothetical protein [Gammaproteobacteria bacterium]